MGKVLLAAALATLLTCAAAPTALAGPMQTMKADADGLVVFTMPSGNIGCTYVPEGGTSVYEPANGGPELICERVEPVYVAVRIGRDGRPQRTDNPDEQGCCSLDQKFAYGRRWSEGPFACKSEKSGLTCTSARGHGFSMSRAAIRTW